MTSAASTPWTEEEDAKLRELWPTHSAGELAPVFGRSRNAVIGRALRLKLAPKKRPSRAKQSAPRRVPQGPRWGQKQRPASLADRNAGAIQVRRYPSHAADAGADTQGPPARSAPVPFVPRWPVPYIESILSDEPGCQYPVDVRAHVEPGQHMQMLVCDEPRDTGSRYCPFHVVHQSMRPAA